VGAASLHPMRALLVRNFQSVPRQTRQTNAVKLNVKRGHMGAYARVTRIFEAPDYQVHQHAPVQKEKNEGGKGKRRRKKSAVDICHADTCCSMFVG